MIILDDFLLLKILEKFCDMGQGGAREGSGRGQGWARDGSIYFCRRGAAPIAIQCANKRKQIEHLTGSDTPRAKDLANKVAISMRTLPHLCKKLIRNLQVMRVPKSLLRQL